MRWIIGGPDLPPELLQSLEDGKLVFFCGAGVSYPAGLPTFQGLVEKVYKLLNQQLAGAEFREFENHNYDRVLGLLENRLGNAPFVRRVVMKVLRIDPAANLPTHKALLSLSKSRDQKCRLVTTNFDRGFEIAAAGKVTIDSAPRLSVPKLGGWNCIVHLHGIINEQHDPDGSSLVLTSADFGTAYLTERWASRFVSELFRRFTVLFVGYSIEDPVIRYMMDAFAADRKLGEGVGIAYVLAGTSEAKRKEDMAAWDAKGVMPVLYEDAENHQALHLTLAKWAACHQNGLFGKESIVRDCGSSKRPVKPFDDDPEVSQVLWALSETTGHIAQVFANLDPIPPIEWLEVFAEHGLSEVRSPPAGQKFLAPLVDAGYRTSAPAPLCPVVKAVAYWLAGHLENPALLNWVLRSGSSLHPEFQEAVRSRLSNNATLPPGIRPIWWALACESNLTWAGGHHYFALFHRFPFDIWNLQTKHTLLGALTPEYEFQPSMRRTFYPEDVVDEEKTAEYAEVKIVLRCRDEWELILGAIQKSSNKLIILAALPDDLTGLLLRAMEMFEVVQLADAKHDDSCLDRPSISPHGQNSELRGWTVLIELLRDAWKKLFAVDRDHARRVVERWRTIRYPLFRRFCFYAMTETDLHTPQECLAYLMEDGGWWLWSIYVYREHFGLLKALWPKLSDQEALQLTSAIIMGPPRAMFRDGISEEQYRQISDRCIWLHLAKLRTWGRELPEGASGALLDLSDKYPAWEFAEGDRDEFASWMEAINGAPAVEKEDEFISATDEVVVDRLISPSENRHKEIRRWQRVIELQPSRASRLLGIMAEAGSWPDDVWEPALQGFSGAKLIAQEWPHFIGYLLAGPDNLFENSTRQIAWILGDGSSLLEPQADAQFWEAWDRTKRFAFLGEDGELDRDPVSRAINIPAGLMTEALLDRLASKRPRSGEDVSESNWARLTAIVDGTTGAHRYARVLVASRLAWLYMLDADWIQCHFLKYLDWERGGEAVAVWEGYLWQSRVTPDLWRAIKRDFLAALGEKHRLGASEEQIATLFGYICIDHRDWFSDEEMQSALRSMDAKGREVVSRVVLHRLQGADNKGEDLWKTSISPWLDVTWPKDRAMVDSHSGFNLAMAATYTGAAFKSAVDLVAPFLTASVHYRQLVDRLNKTEFPEHSPTSVLLLLKVVDTTYNWPDENLRTLLIRLQTQAGLANEARFRGLDEYLRQHYL